MSNIPGLYYQENVIDTVSERNIVEWLDQQTWNTSLQRRTQHYGYEYNYTSKSVSPKTTPITGPLLCVANWLKEKAIISPEQCIVNEYFKGQGISAHTDGKMFGPTIVSISLLEPCNIIFSKEQQKITMTLAPRSILVLSDDARNKWKHEIPKNVKVTLQDGSIYNKPENYRRISLTYRTMVNKT